VSATAIFLGATIGRRTTYASDGLAIDRGAKERMDGLAL
jgi:hypothetical protein